MELMFYPEPKGIEAEIRATARAFAARHLHPFAVEDDNLCVFRRDAFTALATWQGHALSISEKDGGRGLPYRCHYACLEELGRASISFSVATGVTNLVQGAISTFGSPDQKQAYLRPLTRGQWLGAFSLSEPQAGSDAAALRLKAVRSDGGYRLTGTKSWCSNAGHADLYLVMARTGEHRTQGVTAFLVPKDTPGFRVGKQEKKLGLRASTLAELIFEDAFIPDSQRLGAEGEGFKVALSQLDAGRVSIASAGLAAAIESISRAWTHLSQNKREDFGDGSRGMLARHYAAAQAGRLMIGAAADLKDAGTKISTIAAQTKLLMSDLAVHSASDAITVLGPEGCQPTLGVERILRDSKALQIVEGTNQVQLLVLSREIEERVLR